MRKKTFVLMSVAVGCGLAASYLTSRLLAERGEPEKVSVLVAKADISMGTLIASPETMFVAKCFNKGEEPKKAIRTLEELKGRKLNRPVSEDQFVTASDLYDRNDNELPGKLPKGMRAVAIRVNADSQVGGFVQPQSRVDVLSAVALESGKIISKTILQNILVLAVDQSQKTFDGAVVGQTVTVQVTPEQAEQLTVAQRVGIISLSLRPFDDDTVVLPPPPPPPPPPLPVPPPKPEPVVAKIPEPKETKPEPKKKSKVHTMVIYNGAKVTTATFQPPEEN